jgi:hypothetical protein
MTAFLLGAAAGSVRFPLGVLHCVAARRVSARLPSGFHLLAQMKVTKAKGLEHQPFEWFASATRLLPRLWHENTHRTTLSVTSLTFSRSGSFRLDPAGPRRGGVQKSVRLSAVQSLPAAGGSSRATGAAAKAQPVAAQLAPHSLGSSVALPMGRTRKFTCSRSETAKWAGVGALCFGDFHLGQQMKVTRQPGRTPGALQRNAPSLSAAGPKPGGLSPRDPVAGSERNPSDRRSQPPIPLSFRALSRHRRSSAFLIMNREPTNCADA